MCTVCVTFSDRFVHFPFRLLSASLRDFLRLPSVLRVFFLQHTDSFAGIKNDVDSAFSKFYSVVPRTNLHSAHRIKLLRDLGVVHRRAADSSSPRSEYFYT